MRQSEDAKQCLPILALFEPNYLVVDDYALDIQWEAKVRNFAGKIMIVHDFANQYHDYDIFLDENFGRNR